MAILIDSYSESNVDSGKGLYIGGINTEYASQSFNSGDGGTLDYIVFNLYNDGSPPGNMYAEIYAHTGTYGTDSTPTGSPLATSDVVATSSLSSYPGTLITFTFSGIEKINLSNNNNSK